MKCPKCGSEHLQKKGKRAGKQRYKCVECSASFTEGVPYKESIKLPPLDVKCPRCESHKVNRDGKEKDYQRYRCQSCGLGFSEKTNYKALEPIKWSCPYCGGELTYAGYGSKGQRNYYCRSCKKNCSGDIETGEPIKRTVFKTINKEIKCPVCDSFSLKKSGFSKGRQRYTCNNCGKHFVECPEKDVKPMSTRNIIIKKVLDGANLRKLAEEYKYNYDHLRRLVRPFCRNEKISKEQAKLITKYGVHLGVPIDYLSEYVHCSQKMCRTVIAKYKKKLASL